MLLPPCSPSPPPPQATEADLCKLLSSTGTFLWDLQLPRGPDGRVRGFAFASFTSYPEAEKAIKAVNGQLLRKRPIAADWAIGKAQYEGLKGQQQQQQPAAAAAAAGEDGSSEGGSGDSGSEMGESEEGSGLSDTDEQESENEGELESDESAEDDVSGSEDDASGSEDDVSSSGAEQEDADVRAERDTVANALDAVLKQQQQQPLAGKPSKQQQQDQQQTGKQQQKGAAAAAAGGGAPAAAGAAGGVGGAAAVSRTVFVRGLPLDVTSQELQVGLSGNWRLGVQARADAWGSCWRRCHRGSGVGILHPQAFIMPQGMAGKGREHG